MPLDLWYYRNPKGLVAFSADEGETVCIPSGKVLPWAEAWEETMDDLGDELPREQRIVLKKMEQEAQERNSLTGIPLMVAEFEERTKEERSKHQWMEEPKKHRKIPEVAQVICSDLKD